MNQKQENKWYLSTWFIAILCACWFLILPAIGGIVLMIMKTMDEKKQKEANQQIIQQNAQLAAQNAQMNQAMQDMNKTMQDLGVHDHQQSMAKLNQVNAEISENLATIDKLRSDIATLQAKDDKLQKSVATQERKISRAKEIYCSIEYALDNFITADIPYNECRISQSDIEDANLIAPSVILKLHCMDIKSLRKAYRENEKSIDTLRQQYAIRYTTKANKTIYDLIVKGLESEMQNVLYNLKYDKLDNGIEQIKDICAKYLKIAAEGNQTIAGTLTKFIGEMEYLFINAAKIEYNYYVKKEQAKQEQLAIKEQMRQEAEERKALEAERKKVELEESKYENQISSLKEQAEASEGEALAALQDRIL